FFCTTLSSAFANDYSVGFKVGTMGLGVELNKPLQESLDFRLSLNYIEGQVSNFKVGSIEYDVDASATSIQAVLDWYPKQNKKLYLSGGFLLGNDNINPEPTPDFVFRGVKIGQALDRFDVDLNVDYGDIAPYIGVGYSNKVAKDKGWYYSAELGLAYLGMPKVGFNIIDKTTGKTPTLIPQEELDKELVRIKNKVDNYKIFPVMSFSWIYRF
ncbi:MAG: hypothetical protein KAG34_12540, partial [Cocleimonas sp.]|nr:hypothetical protein [Cocleimonas sp.]